MSRHSPPQPDRMTAPPSPAEIIECHPVPRVQLVVVLEITPNSDSAKLTLSTAHFISTIQSADRKLRLVVDPARSSVRDDEVTLVFTPPPLGVETTTRLGNLVGVVREAIAVFGEATLIRAEVVPQVS